MTYFLKKTMILLIAFGGSFCFTEKTFACAQHGTSPEAAPILKIKGPYIRATNGKNGAAYLKIKNISSEDRKLLKAETPVATTVELHKTVEEMVGGNAVMKMQQVEFISLPANDITELAPGGFHIMLLGLKAPLKIGDKIDLALYFDKGEPLTLAVPVKGTGYKGCRCRQ